MTRYSRHTLLPQIGEAGQQILLESKVAVIGCGALGTHVSNNLARAGVGYIRLVDRDVVEWTNLQRQVLFDEDDIGLPKVMAATGKLRRINSEIVLEPVIKDVNDSNIENLIRGFDLVADATDNFRTRMLINDACVKHAVPWIYAGVIQTRGMTMNILPGGACFRCVLPGLPPPGSTPTCETAGVLNTIPAVIAAMESTEAVRILLKGAVRNRLLFFDAWSGHFNRIDLVRDEDCECCVKKKFEFLGSQHRETIVRLCQNGVQIIPPAGMTLNLKQLAENLRRSLNVVGDEHYLTFRAEDKKITIFDDGRAIIRGSGDKGVARSIYARYIGQ